jgi:hypothetical protein
MNSLACQRELYGTRPYAPPASQDVFAIFSLPFQKFIPFGDSDRAKIEYG